MEKNETEKKWECFNCTYFNFLKNQKCCMCHTKKKGDEMSSLGSSTPIISTSKDNSFLYINHVSSNPQPSDYDSSLIEKVKQLHLQTSNTDPTIKRTTVTDLSAFATSSSTSKSSGTEDVDQKWICTVCTYENYPKSSKCVMCASKKELIIRNQNIISIENDEIDENACAINYYTSSPSMLDDSYTAKNNLKNLPNNTNELEVHHERRLHHLKRQTDCNRLWLNAVRGIVDGDDLNAVENYLNCGGNVARALTSHEVQILNRPSAFDVGYTLIHLCIRFQRDELLPRLLAQITTNGPSGVKFSPEKVAPDIAEQIRRHFVQILRTRKSLLSCSYVNEHATFSLPAYDIEELPLAIQEQLYDELLDRDAQKQLEHPPPALNWSIEITSRLSSRLMVLWNRSAGDCLLDSVMQATWGVFDRDNVLRRALFDSLHQCSSFFFTRWREYEMAYQASALLHFTGDLVTLEEQQWERDWKNLLTQASQPGASLEQLHIFVLSHILRRPILVYGVKVHRTYRGDAISPARFEGLYLPLLFEQSFCIKSPLALGYTRGHFSALVPCQRLDETREEDVTYLPLMSCDNKLIPIHFLSQAEMGHEEKLMRNWMDVCFTEGGIMVAQMKIHKRPLLVAQLLEEWLNYYRRKKQIISPMIQSPKIIGLEGYLSDGDTDEE